MKRTAILSCLLPILAACANPPGNDGPERAPGERGQVVGDWAVAAVDGRPSPEGVRTTLVFGSDRVGGTTGCNHYTAPLERDGSSLRIGNVVSTRKACAPAVMGQERRFLRGLDEVTDYRMAEDGLLLLDADGRERIRLVHGEPRR